MTAPTTEVLRPNAADSEVDRRYLELAAAVVDATKLDQLPTVDPLIDGVLFQNSLAWLHGKPGHAKSLVALDWACCVATGRPWRGRHVAAGTVLYVVAEGAHGMDDRRKAWELANGATVAPGRLTFLPIAVQLLKGLDVAALTLLVQELNPVFIVVDTQARVTVGAEENSSRDMGLLVAAVDRLRTVCGSSVLLVHHEARAGDSLRGSTALEGAATTVIRCTKDGNLVRLDCTKQKDAPEFDPILFRLGVFGPSVARSHDTVGLTDISTESESHIIATLRDSFGTTGAGSTTLRETTGLPKSTYFRSLNALVRRGVVVNAGSKTRTRYVLAEMEDML